MLATFFMLAHVCVHACVCIFTFYWFVKFAKLEITYPFQAASGPRHSHTFWQ